MIRRRVGSDSKSGGFVLVVVLIAVALLSYSLYSFADSMLYEYKAVRHTVVASQQSQIAASGVSYARFKLTNRDAVSRARFLYTRGDCRLRIGSIDGLDATVDLAGGPTVFADRRMKPHRAFGLANESGKLSINSLPLDESRAAEARARLTAFPGVDLSIADSILDWLDTDDDPRPFGAETSYYSSLGYRPRQGEVSDLSELLRVKGVTLELLFGEDQNRNGWMDSNENDGDVSLPRDNRDGRLDLGLSGWITVVGRESTLGSNGLPKLDVNSRSLVDLFDSLAPMLGEEAARFIVAYRLWGPMEPPRPEDNDKESERLRRLDSAEKRLRRQLGDTSSGRLRSPSKNSFRAGLDLSPEGTIPIVSLIDLIGARVLVNTGTEEDILSSPWEPTAQGIRLAAIQLESQLTTSSAATRCDRLNPACATEESLLTIPGISQGQVKSILKAKERIHIEGNGGLKFRDLSWLLTDAGFSFEQLQTISPYVTTGGDVFQGFALGRVDQSKTQSVVSFGVDATSKNPVIMYSRNLRAIPFHNENTDVSF